MRYAGEWTDNFSISQSPGAGPGRGRGSRAPRLQTISRAQEAHDIISVAVWLQAMLAN